MDAYKLYTEAGAFLNRYIMHSHFSGKPLPRNSQKRKDLLNDIVLTTKNIKLPRDKSIFHEPISRIKLKGNYPRKLVVQVFSKLDLKVTRYTREYGRTIVYFEDASNLPQ